MTTAGLRRLVEIYSEYLVKGIQLVNHKDTGKDLPESELEFLSFRKKLRTFHTRLGADGVPLDKLHRHKLLSLNRARNCLEHQRGLVTEENTRRNHLVVTYEKRSITGRVSKPSEPSGFVLQITQKKVTRKFAVGESISFTPTEFTQICQTFANHVMYATRVLRGEPIDQPIEQNLMFRGMV